MLNLASAGDWAFCQLLVHTMNNKYIHAIKYSMLIFFCLNFFLSSHNLHLSILSLYVFPVVFTFWNSDLSTAMLIDYASELSHFKVSNGHHRNGILSFQGKYKFFGRFPLSHATVFNMLTSINRLKSR